MAVIDSFPPPSILTLLTDNGVQIADYSLNDETITMMNNFLNSLTWKEEEQRYEDSSATGVVAPKPINMQSFQVVDKVNTFHMGFIPARERSDFISLLKAIGDSDDENDDNVTVTSTSDSSCSSGSSSTMMEDISLSIMNCDQWTARYKELVEYKARFGNCHIPYDWAPNKPLSQWVKRQRHQRRLRTEGKHSNLSEEREKLLHDLGFIWDSRAANWEERLNELQEFKDIHGHCKVTNKHGKSCRPLSVWLKRQRHAVREFLKGKPDTGMTDDRLSRLVDLGVKFNLRRSK